ncbi:MAG TPA: HAMP domain-containing sensor histidine kinase [Chloroflexota bacterium]|nr:HAMP domain-containing sensor histidine kinase [Chloroflexota bacterium]
MLTAVLLGGALIVGAGGLFLSTQLLVALAAVAFLWCAAACWRIARRTETAVADSRAWAEVALLQSLLRERDALWAAVPAAWAMWDAEDRPLLASAAWQALGLSAETPPTENEVSIGDPARIFVAEASALANGGRLVLLREVTSEREALRAKDELLAVVGHELRTPLSSIKGYGQLMARQLATVQEQVQRLDQLAGDVMDTARADGGRLTLQREVLSVADLIEAAAGRFRTANPSRSLELEVAPCPPIEGDPARLGQVLDNLLSNAAKYSPPETVITLRGSVEDHWVRIAVVDRGAGIAPEHLPRLFERFYRVPAGEKDAPPGFGLGLSIVRDLVEAHGGRIEVVSKGVAQGCTFTVVLPAPPLAP